MGESPLNIGGRDFAPELMTIATKMIMEFSKSILVFTDLDGTLLDHDTYSCEAASPAIQDLLQRQIPIIPCTSKTFDEGCLFMQERGWSSPFIFENGGGVAVPDSLMAKLWPGFNGDLLSGYGVRLLGVPRTRLIEEAQRLKKQLALKIELASDMGADHFSKLTGLPVDAAALALKRKVSEPVNWLDTDEKLQEFNRQLQRVSLQAVKGGRLVSVQGNNNKANAARFVTDLYRTAVAANCRTVALGDAANDREMLEWADFAIVIPKPSGEHLSVNKPDTDLILASAAGPAGWNTAIKQLLNLWALH